MTELCYWLGALNQHGLHSFKACCCSVRTHFTTLEKSVTTTLCIQDSEFHSLWHSYSCRCADHGEIWGSQGICPLALSLGTRLRWLVSFVHQHLYIWGNSSLYPLNRRLGELQSYLDALGKKNIYCTQWDFSNSFVVKPTALLTLDVLHKQCQKGECRLDIIHDTSVSHTDIYYSLPTVTCMDTKANSLNFLRDATNCNLKLLYSSHSDCHDWRWLDIDTCTTVYEKWSLFKSAYNNISGILYTTALLNYNRDKLGTASFTYVSSVRTFFCIHTTQNCEPWEHNIQQTTTLQPRDLNFSKYMIYKWKFHFHRCVWEESLLSLKATLFLTLVLN